MYQKELVCARFRDWQRKRTGFISLEEIWDQREQNDPFSTFEDFLSRSAAIFAWKRWITFNPNASVENWSFWDRKLRPRRKRSRRFQFWSFHEPLLKRLRDLLKFPNVNLEREIWVEMNTEIHFPDWNYKNASCRGISFPNWFWKSRTVIWNHQFDSLFTKPY